MVVERLLALLLGSAAPGLSSIDAAHQILTRAGGSLRRLSQLPIASLTAMHFARIIQEVSGGLDFIDREGPATGGERDEG